MKRFITILAALLAFGLAASAQLNVTHKGEKTEKIATARMGYVRLYQSGEKFYMTLPSNNRFEKSEIFWLGESIDSAVQTLDDIVGLYDTLEDSMTVTDATGEEVIIIKDGANLNFFWKVQAGNRWLSKPEAKKLQNALQILQWTINHPEVTDNP